MHCKKLGLRVLGGFLLAAGVLGTSLADGRAASPALATHDQTWSAMVLAGRQSLRVSGLNPTEVQAQALIIRRQLEQQFPVHSDWLMQDYALAWESLLLDKDLVGTANKLVNKAVGRIDLQDRVPPSSGARSGSAPDVVEEQACLDLYARACAERRKARLITLRQLHLPILFTKHYNLGGSHYAYTEGQSDAQDERHFQPGAALCVYELDDQFGRTRSLLEDPQGVIRDPAVSWDGNNILFAWKKSDREDDYHLYEMAVSSGQIRPLTSGLGFCDYEGAYLPSGDIIFTSTRCVQTVDCWWTEVSNLYTCDRNGKYLRRLAFDQVHDNYPTILADGRVIYTRWEYNDRGQIFVQGLFQMNADGTAQTEFYGNNSFFPTSILHARGIPGSTKVLAIFSGHHTLQVGKLGLLDPAKGRQENSGAQLIAPIRETRAEHIDAYGQEGGLFQYPYPLNEREYLVAYTPRGWADKNPRFGIYYFDQDGKRELLVSDPAISCNQPIPLAPRSSPNIHPSVVDYKQTEGAYYVQDVYSGPGLNGIPRGTIQSLRVVALEYRVAGIGMNTSGGPAGGALASTPVATGNGSWDVKRVLGEATVFEDGSACFVVPARTPVYFQLLDQNRHVVQTMRSWSTLQPGEYFSCTGCHESKNTAPGSAGSNKTLAMKAGPQRLKPIDGKPRGFSFSQEIQPLLNRHCISCHNDARQLPVLASFQVESVPPRETPPGVERSFTLMDTGVLDPGAKRKWTAGYVALTRPFVRDANRPNCTLAGEPDELVNWVHAQSAPPMLPPYGQGASKSRLISMLTAGHKGVQLSRDDLDKIACWIDLAVPFCGDYLEANTWSAAEKAKYDHFLQKRKRMEELEKRNIAEYVENQERLRQAASAVKPARP